MRIDSNSLVTDPPPNPVAQQILPFQVGLCYAVFGPLVTFLSHDELIQSYIIPSMSSISGEARYTWLEESSSRGAVGPRSSKHEGPTAIMQEGFWHMLTSSPRLPAYLLFHASDCFPVVLCILWIIKVSLSSLRAYGGSFTEQNRGGISVARGTLPHYSAFLLTQVGSP